MANPTPPDPPRRVERDEWIAIFVTLATLGGLGFWILTGGSLRRITPRAMFDMAGEGDRQPDRNGRRRDDDDETAVTRQEPSVPLTGRESPELERSERVPPRDRVTEGDAGRTRQQQAEDEGRRRVLLPGRRDDASQERGAAAGIATGIILGDQARTLIEEQDSSPDAAPGVDQPAPSETETVPDEELAGVPTSEADLDEDDGTAVGVSPEVNDTVGEPVNFVDVEDGYWAKPYIDAMSARGLIQGVESDRFAPEEPVTRAQYARLVEQVFEGDEDLLDGLDFVDIDDDYWAASAIESSVRWGFLSGYPGLEFRPEQSISRLEVLLSLRAGLNLSEPDNPDQVLQAYGDRDQISDWAKPPISAAVAAELERSRPDTQELDLEREATRGEVTAMFYQALVRAGIADPLP